MLNCLGGVPPDTMQVVTSQPIAPGKDICLGGRTFHLVSFLGSGNFSQLYSIKNSTQALRVRKFAAPASCISVCS